MVSGGSRPGSLTKPHLPPAMKIEFFLGPIWIFFFCQASLPDGHHPAGLQKWHQEQSCNGHGDSGVFALKMPYKLAGENQGTPEGLQ